MDPTTPRQFDNVYYKNLRQGKGLFTSDHDLFTHRRSKPTVDLWASNEQLFNQAFGNSMITLGRVGRNGFGLEGFGSKSQISVFAKSCSAMISNPKVCDLSELRVKGGLEFGLLFGSLGLCVSS
ncbi:unnamed protein product [Arabis nemorensis]|uniref:peroxidase n=1 Tax=Arabis nemorensis TaxID=586526 RepID=A0A565C8H1_9BRAS|nr:unnamed protein product [Arabis nemorensis]